DRPQLRRGRPAHAAHGPPAGDAGAALRHEVRRGLPATLAGPADGAGARAAGPRSRHRPGHQNRGRRQLPPRLPDDGLRRAAGAEKVLLQTQGGHSLTLEDTPAGGKVTLETPGGRTLTLDDTPPGGVTLASAAGVRLSFSDAGGTLTLTAPLGVTVQSGGPLT